MQHSVERKTMDNYSRATQEVSKCFNEQDCFLHRVPVELFQMIKGIFEEATLKAETVGYRYQKQLLEWSGTPGNKKMVVLYKAHSRWFHLQRLSIEVLRERRGMRDNFRCERECVWRIRK